MIKVERIGSGVGPVIKEEEGRSRKWVTSKGDKSPRGERALNILAGRRGCSTKKKY